MKTMQIQNRRSQKSIIKGNYNYSFCNNLTPLPELPDLIL